MRIQSHMLPIRIIVDIIIPCPYPLSIDGRGEIRLGFDVAADHGLDMLGAAGREGRMVVPLCSGGCLWIESLGVVN